MHGAASPRHGGGVPKFWNLLQSDGEAIPVEDLVGLARDRTAVSRNRLVEGLAELYFARLGDVGDDERDVMAEILRRLVHEVELLVRRRLAARFSDEPDAPAELVRVLANDEAEVTHPILKASPVLDAAELIRIIHDRTMCHRHSIAQWAGISEPVSEALVADGDVTVIETLIANLGAALSADTMADLVEGSCEIDAYRAPLLDRRKMK